MRDQDVADIVGRQSELAELIATVLAGILVDRLVQDLGRAAVHLLDVADAGIYQDGFVASEHQPDVQRVIVDLIRIAAVKRVATADLTVSIEQWIDAIYRCGGVRVVIRRGNRQHRPTDQDEHRRDQTARPELHSVSPADWAPDLRCCIVSRGVAAGNR